MNPIVSVTPNPTLDLGGMVNEVLPNEKNYVHNETRYPGGNGINAARIIHRLGIPVITTGFLGGGVGLEIESLLASEDLNLNFIKIQNPSRISVTVSNQKTHLQTRLSFAGPHVSPKDWESLEKYLMSIPAKSLVILGGSLPPGINESSFAQLITSLTKREIVCIVDVPSRTLKKTYQAGPLMIKPNLIEFQELIGKEVSSLVEVIAEAQLLLNKIPLICISSVEDGALLVSENGIWFGRIPKVEIRTTVGAGDSMVGSMAAKLAEWQNSESEKSYKAIGQERGHELLQWGLAASCATLTVHGTQLGSADDIHKYYPEIFIKDLRE